jgi:3-hydroxyacyl-CoA dehydrogenase
VCPLEDTPANEPDRKFPLVEVVCGPGSRTGTVDIVKRALNHYGFDDVTVKQSDAPLMA